MSYMGSQARNLLNQLKMLLPDGIKLRHYHNTPQATRLRLRWSRGGYLNAYMRADGYTMVTFSQTEYSGDHIENLVLALSIVPLMSAVVQEWKHDNT